MGVDPGAAAFAFALGAGSFFSPCSVALLPAYVGYYLGLGRADPPASAWTRIREGARMGGAAAGGIVALYALGGGVVYALRTLVRVPSSRLGLTLGVLGLAVGLGLLALGVLMALDRAPAIRAPVRAPQGRTIRSFFLFGVAFALASLGCTLPLFLAVAANVVVQGPAGGAVLVLAFGAGVAGLMLAATLGLAVAEQATTRLLRRVARWVRPVGAAALALAGLYVVYYYAVLAPPW